MGIGAVIFDFNGVLVDDESVHFALFQEVLAQEGVAITEQDYHERYLGYDDRGCFEAALRDGGQAADRVRLDELIARKARRYVEVAEQGLRFFPAAAEIAAGRGVAVAGGDQLGGPAARDRVRPAADGMPRDGRRRSSRPRTPTSASPTPRAIGWPWPRCGPVAGRPARDTARRENSPPPTAW